ncbi:MAG: hypothetical protein MUC35_01580 [Candidatus Margulisbacteria bacterium]|jgi:hypothetical protein|nr:hypothetical protein [Candidatus Margulisiibacteriota bacterium]
MSVNKADSTMGKGGLEFYQKMDASGAGKDFTSKMTKELLQTHANARYQQSMAAQKNLANSYKV